MKREPDPQPRWSSIREQASDAPLTNVAIVGRPNVGKSALFNRLMGRQIAIVHDQPGVTRDRLSGVCTGGAHPFVLWDTGGIGGAGESELNKQVRQTVDAAVQQSDVLLLLVDAQHGLSPIDQELGRLLRRSGKPVILVINKIDHAKHEDLAAEFDSLGFGYSVSVSAAHGMGLSDLLEQIETILAQRSSGVDEERSAQPPSRETADETPPLLGSAEPLHIAVVGRPNVGKSSLINAITQSDRAIVSELPGTTRDSVDISYRLGSDEFLLIDTAGIRRRARHSSSVEVFSVMRSERSIRRADLCVLAVDVTSGVTAQDKKIAGLIQEAIKPAIILINKFDLVSQEQSSGNLIERIVDETRERLFFLNYAPVLVTSAVTGEHVAKLFRLIKRVERAAQIRIGTGRLNRLLRAALAANPPPMVSGRRLKLLYATQTSFGTAKRPLQPPEFVLFVNDARLLGQTYRRYLEAQIRQEQAYPGLPIVLILRPRKEGTQATNTRKN